MTVHGCYGMQVCSLLMNGDKDVEVPYNAIHLLSLLLSEDPAQRPLLPQVQVMPFLS